MHPISHIETVFGHALAVLCGKLGVQQKLSLRVVPEATDGPEFYRFDKADGIFTMSDDLFRKDPNIPWYAIARLVGTVAYEENPNSGKTHVLDGTAELSELRVFEQGLLEDGDEGMIQTRFFKELVPKDPEGEICSEEEALSLVGGGFVNTIHEPPGTGRGAVSYQWKDDGEFLIRSESTMSRDVNGKLRFTETEYRKIPRERY